MEIDMAARHIKPLLAESINLRIDDIQNRCVRGDKTRVARRLNMAVCNLDKFFSAPSALSLHKLHEIIETFERYFKEVGR